MTYFYKDKSGATNSDYARSTTEAIDRCRKYGYTFIGVSSYPIYLYDGRP